MGRTNRRRLLHIESLESISEAMLLAVGGVKPRKTIHGLCHQAET